MAISMRDQVFISYHRGDRVWMHELRKYLRPMEQFGLVSIWSDEEIPAGAKWLDELQAALAKAKVAVFLVTQDFLNSEFIREFELKPLLSAAETGEVSIVWIPVRASGYKQMEFAPIQSIIPPDNPVAQMDEGVRDKVWVTISEKIDEPARPSQTNRTLGVAVAPPGLTIAHADAQPPAHTQLLIDIQSELRHGKLRDASIAKTLLERLSEAPGLELSDDYNRIWTKVGISGLRASDELLRRLDSSAGIRDWQLDFFAAVAPVLVGTTKCLKQSSEAQALLLRLCESLANRLKLSLEWPDDADQRNGRANSIYTACLDARELESEDVVFELSKLTIHLLKQ